MNDSDTLSRGGVQEDHSASYFSHSNEDATRLREQLASDSLEMLISWLKDGGNVGIHGIACVYSCLRPAPDVGARCDEQQRAPKVPSSLAAHDAGRRPPRRTSIVQRVAREKGIHVIFLESICNDPAVIAANVALKVSSGDPDYKDMSPEQARDDFLRRIRHYETVYETITDTEAISSLRITDVGNQVSVCNIHGYLQSRIAFYLMNLHLKPRSIFFSRVRPPRAARASGGC
jgi:6-phosphofructo-2-kinase/fructose-2,6-biphosphatase 2